MRPDAIGTEQAVLGALMLDNASFRLVCDRLAAEDFERRDHALIFRAITALASAGSPMDAVTVFEQLKRDGHDDQTGGLTYLVQVTRETPSAANVRAYAAAVRERAALRKVQSVAAQLSAVAADSGGLSSDEIVADAVASLLKLRQSVQKGAGLVDARRLTGELLDDLERRRGGPLGLRVGLSDFDELTGGLEPGDLVVIAARPGMHKTGLATTIAGHVAQATAVSFFSAEMPASQLMRRCLANASSVSQGLLRRADRLTDEHWAALTPAVQQVARKRLWIDDRAAPTLAHIRAETTALHASEGLGLVIVDYLQLVRGTGRNRYEELREVAYGLKSLAKDLSVPIIALAQLNRGVESREEKRPHISDLRDSGAIEEAADIIGLLYSEGYYDTEFSMPYVLECSISKNRNGERGECFWNADGAHSRIEVLVPGARAQYRQLRAKQHQHRTRGADL